MLGMSLLSFLILTFIGAVVAASYHYVIRYRFLEGNDALVGKLIIGLEPGWVLRYLVTGSGRLRTCTSCPLCWARSQQST